VPEGAAALLALGLLLAGCGTSGQAASAGADALTITVSTDEGAAARTYELECDPPGGDHPQPEQACAAVTRAGRAIFEPVPADRACTQLYGGPQEATVRGTWDGERVDARFTRTNGCEIDRWDRLGTTFFDVPML
jgi:hypothetical protein